MTPDPSRRFTDREVALVLRKASELDDVAGTGPAAGLTLKQLEEIAAEVGIAPELVQRAVADLDTRGGASGLLAGGPLARQALRAVPGEVGREAMARLMQHVEANADQVGQVTEALGATQWTARDRFRTTQVSITPAAGETRVRVVERAAHRLRRVAHVIPTMMGLALAAGSLGILEPRSALALPFLAAGAAAGLAAGRILWGRISRESGARVERLAAELAREAESLPRAAGGDR